MRAERKILTDSEIQSLLEGLTQKFGGTWGYAGSYARGAAKLRSDLDIVYKGPGKDLDIFAVWDFLRDSISIKCDTLDLDALEAEDKERDKGLETLGIGINEHSVYKTIIEDAIWYGESKGKERPGNKNRSKRSLSKDIQTLYSIYEIIRDIKEADEYDEFWMQEEILGIQSMHILQVAVKSSILTKPSRDSIDALAGGRLYKYKRAFAFDHESEDGRAEVERLVHELKSENTVQQVIARMKYCKEHRKYK